VQPDGTSLRRCREFYAPGFNELGEALAERLGVTGTLYPFAWLIEDSPGYRIRSHTDCAGKVITCQVYLAEDDCHEDHGVVLHTRDRKVRRQIPYRFNFGYAFKVTANSWHRVERATACRRSLQLIYYSVPNPNV